MAATGADPMVLDIDEGSFYRTTLAWRNVAAGGDIVALPTFEQLGTPGSVEAFDAITGTTQWTVGLPGQPLMDIGGLAASGTVVAVAIGRREANQAIAGIDATLGDVIWTSPMENISRIDAGVVFDPGLDRDRSRVHRCVRRDPSSRQIPLAGRWGPAIGEAAVVLAGAIPDVVTAYDPVSGAERWATLAVRHNAFPIT